jgi:thioredoxin-like negative regulator of GroEL
MASSARIEELEKKFNENPRRYFAPLANEYRKAGDVQQAIAICRTYVPQQPGHMSGHIVFGQALFEAGDHDEARGVFEAALALDPENLIALRHLGDIAREHGESDDARSWYRRVLDADPRNDEVATLLTSVEADQAAAADAPATWMEINPEQTLELPPDVLVPGPRELGFVGAPQPRPQPSPASTMGELFETGSSVADASRSPDAIGAATLEFSPRAQPTSPSQPAPLSRSAEFRDYVDEAAKTVPTFVTETMAELYVQQGFHDQALAVYRQLLTQHPGDPKLADRVEQLRRQSAPTPPRTETLAATPVDPSSPTHAARSLHSVRDFFSELALRRPKVRADAPAASAPLAAEPPEASAPPEPAAASPSSAMSLTMAASALLSDFTPSAPPSAEAPIVAASSHAEPSATPPIIPPPSEPAVETMTAADADSTPRDLDLDFTDASFHETYSAEFGASALVVPTDADVPSVLVESSDDRVDSLVMRPSGEADPLSLGAIGTPSGFSVNESTEFDVAAFDAGDMSLSNQKPPVEEPPAAPLDASGSAAVGGAAPAGPGDAEVASESVGDRSSESVGTASAETDRGAEPTPTADRAGGSGGAPTEAARDLMQTGSVNLLFPQHTVSAPDEAAAAALSSAFGGPSPKSDTPPSSSRPARPALNELSLDSVFRESPAASPDLRRESTAFSFDQFFGETPPALQSGSAGGADAPASDSLDVGSADAEQFSNWLSGLKKK